MDLLLTVGSVQDVECCYLLLLTFALHPLVDPYPHLWRRIRNQASFSGRQRGTMQLSGINFRSLPSQYHLSSYTQLAVFLFYYMINFAFITVKLTLLSPGLHCTCLVSGCSPVSVLQFMSEVIADCCSFGHLNAIGLQDLTSHCLFKLSPDF